MKKGDAKIILTLAERGSKELDTKGDDWISTLSDILLDITVIAKRNL